MADDISIVIGAQDKASSVIDSVAKKVGGFSTSFASVVPVIGAVTGAIAGVTAGFAAMSGAINAVQSAADKIDALTDTANGLNAAVGDLQAFQFAMSEAGNVSAEGSIAALQKVQKIVGEVASGGNAGAASIFEQLNIDANELSLQSPIDQFMTLKAGLAGIENVSERAATAQALLGKSAADLIPALISEQEEFGASMQAANEFGATVSEEGAQGIAAMNDALGRVTAGMEGLANQVAVAVAPAVESLAIAIAEWIPPTIELADQYLPSIVDGMILIVGHAYDFAETMHKASTFDFVGMFNSIADGATTAGKMQAEVDAARQRAQEAAIANEEKRKALAEVNRGIDEEGVKAAEKKAEAVAKTIEQLERELAVAQMGEDLVKSQEQLAQATNDSERERIQLLQEQIAAQEKMNKSIEDQKKADEEAAKEREKEAEKAAKEQEDIAKKVADFQPGTQATESRLLTRGPAEKGIDKIASNTAEAKTLLQQIKDALSKGGGDALTVTVIS